MNSLGFFVLLHALSTQVEFRNENPEFTIRLPAGYEPLTPAPPGVNGGWRRSVGSEGIAVTMQILPGTIGMDSTDVEKMKGSFAKKFPQARSFDVRKEKWRTFEILVLQTEVGEGQGFMLSTQIPLTPKAVQLRVAGPMALKDAVAQDFRSVIDSVSGPTNWLNGSELTFLYIGLVLAISGWLLYLSYGVTWGIFLRSQPDRALFARAVWMCATAGLMGTALFGSLSLAKENPTGAPGQVIGLLAVVDCVLRANRLLKRRTTLAAGPKPLNP